MASQKLTGMAREVAEKYRETLVTLTFNNKIVINTLTEIAKEDTKYANVIVDCIEARLRKVSFITGVTFSAKANFPHLIKGPSLFRMIFPFVISHSWEQ